MTSRNNNRDELRGKPRVESELSPLGMGHAPAKDPLKQFTGMVLANGLTMEVITLVLALLALRMLYNGELWTTTTIALVGAWLAFHVIMFAFMKKPWALAVIFAGQIVGAAMGIFIHSSVLAVAIIFAMLWGLALYLRSIIVERMRRGYLTTQHLDAPQ